MAEDEPRKVKKEKKIGTRNLNKTRGRIIKESEDGEKKKKSGITRMKLKRNYNIYI